MHMEKHSETELLVSQPPLVVPLDEYVMRKENLLSQIAQLQAEIERLEILITEARTMGVKTREEVNGTRDVIDPIW